MDLKDLGSSENRKTEAWKAMVGLCEKLFFLAIGALVAPVILGKVKYPALALLLGSMGGMLSFGIWLYLVLKEYFRED